MMVMMAVFFLVSAVVVINVGSATTLSQTHPSYVPVCPGDTVTFTCTTTTTGNAYWSLNSDGSNSIAFFATEHEEGKTFQLPPFTLTLLNKTGSNSDSTLVTTATVDNSTYGLNGMSIYCSGNGTNFNGKSITVRNITSVGPPVGLSVTALNDSSVNLSWSPPLNDSIHCITGYIISSRDDHIPVVMTSTNTLVLSHGLSYGNTYNFTVAAVDKTNTTGSYSQHVIINLSVPNVVSNLNYTSSPGDGTIAVYWNSPVNNYHPDIIHYIILYTNMTDDTSHDVTSDVTNYTLRGVSGGSTYSISVSAVNIIGEGANDTIYVSLVYVSPTPPSSAVYTTDVSSSTIDSTSTTSDDVTLFTSTLSTLSTSTPSTRPPPSSHATILSSIIPSTSIIAVYITSTSVIQQCIEYTDPVTSVAISVPITVILTAVVTSIVSSLVTYYCCWLKSKGRSDSYSPPAGQHHDIPPGDGAGVGVDLKDNMAYGQVTAGRPPVLPVYETVNI